MNALSRSLLLGLTILVGCSPQASDPDKTEPKPGQQPVVAQPAVAQTSPPLHDAATARPSESNELAVAAQPLSKEKRAAGMGASLGAHGAMVAAPPSVWHTESYNPVKENGFINAGRDPLSTFSIDVDTAGYANVRRFVQGGSLPPAGAAAPRTPTTAWTRWPTKPRRGRAPPGRAQASPPT